MKIYGYTYELQPNGTIIKSSIRMGFLILIWLAVAIAIASMVMYEFNFIILARIMRDLKDAAGNPVLTPAEFRLTLGAMTFIPLPVIIAILTLAFGGKTGQKYIESNNLSVVTPATPQPEAANL